ncbi:perlucin-like [Penaeus chinensis]|uniref:perlucin-like n=1 Tax=Penaeus chinensis TaxID=139456 RepID=UPI001FB6CDF2|nr:perlucin-like [Penaeus chinensis]XP_047498148.1 perlucin-like [Penaeus chinensis]
MMLASMPEHPASRPSPKTFAKHDLAKRRREGFVSKGRARSSLWCTALTAAVLVLLLFAQQARCSPEVTAKREKAAGIWNKSGRSCPMAFHEIGGRCYFYGYFPLNWYRASEFCHSFGKGVSLACIESAKENFHIKQWLGVNGNHNTGVWVGGSDNGHVGRWAWFPTGQLVSYSNWGPSQPSGGDQHCMYLVGGLLGYQWADFHCDFDMHFLCEYGVNDLEPWR